MVIVLLLLVEIMHHLFYMYMYYAARIPLLLVYEVYIRQDSGFPSSTVGLSTDFMGVWCNEFPTGPWYWPLAALQLSQVWAPGLQVGL